MRHLAIALTGLWFTTLLGCGDRRTDETAGVADTAVTVTTPAVADEPVEARDYAYDERDGFANSIRQQLAELDTEIEQLAAAAKSRGGAVSDRRLADVRAARQAVNRHLARIDNATADNWDDIKQAVNEAVEHVSEAIETAQPK